MLGHRGITKAEELGEIADRALAVDQLADNQQPMAIGQRLQEVAGLVGRGFHHCTIYFHTCVYTIVRIYSQATRPPNRGKPAPPPTGECSQRRRSCRKLSLSEPASAER